MFCFFCSSTRKHEQFRVHLPDSITTWSTQAFALSEVHGFGLSQMSPLVSIKRFFVDFTLPYSVIRGEQVRLPVSVYNYQDICVQVRPICFLLFVSLLFQFVFVVCVYFSLEKNLNNYQLKHKIKNPPCFFKQQYSTDECRITRIIFFVDESYFAILAVFRLL